MKTVRFLYEDAPLDGVIEGPEIVSDSVGRLAVDSVRILPPAVPTKIVSVGLNYGDHAAELGMPVPDEPVIFIKPSTSVIGHGDIIRYPDASARVDYEAELGVVIGSTARNVRRGDARGFIKGYTCVNDVTARDLQKKDGQWTRAKSFDSFAPVGPCIETDLDPADLAVRAWLNGEVRQDSRTSELVFDIPRLIEFISGIMTLLPGDIIATGTPANVGPMEPGDEVSVEIEGIGRLTNRVARAGEDF